MSQSRQLAAIMFTDIVGYTALMGDDEQKAIELLNENRHLQKPLIEQHGGKWIKELGDGVLASFSTVTDAVYCACQIMKGCDNIEGLKLRIGIHLGEVLFENDDVFGDGVNIASRLQALAPIGNIWVSESVYKNVSNRKDICTKFIREEVLKNVKEPVHIYEVITNYRETLNKQLSSPIEKNKQEEKTVAVLPFLDMSQSHDQEYLSDGLAEDIINALMQIKELRVIGRTSSFSFKGTKKDLKTIGKTLGVNTILEGSVQKLGNRIRITAQLINAEDGYHIWSQRYDREMDDIFAIQDDISMKISENLKVTLFGGHEKKEEDMPTRNMEAYELYLKGRFCLEKGVEGFLKAIQYFQKAIELDNLFADACWCLGFSYFHAQIYLLLPNKESIASAKHYTHKAIKLDQHNADAHFLLAIIYMFYDRDWEKANVEIELGNKLKVTYTVSKYIAAEPWYYGMVCGDFKLAIYQLEKSIENDPLSAYYQLQLAYLTIYGLRNYEQTRIYLHRILELEPSHSEALRMMGNSYLFENKYEIAKDYYHKALNSAKGKGFARVNLIMCSAASGRKEEGLKMFEHWKQTLNPAESRAFLNIIINAYLGNNDEAFAWFDKAFEEHEFWLISLKYSPEWDLLRPDPRFQKVLDRMNFPV